MKLRGIDFGPALDAAGARNFFGNGYAHHGLLKRLGLLDSAGCKIVAKTTTLHARRGNMPMKRDGITPQEILPKCILPNFRPRSFALSLRMYLKGIMLNAVDLSGPGAGFLFETGRWQKMTGPLVLSFMAVEKKTCDRIFETAEFARLLKHYLPGFHAHVALQVNKSCPNVRLDPDSLVDEVVPEMEFLSELGIPLMYKFNILVPVEAVKRIAESSHCDAICVSNTIPWGKLSELIDWKGLFGTNISPLAEYGGGGLSGAPLLPLVANWVAGARQAGITKPINAGGGILCPDDVTTLYRAGASSVFIGSVATLRPWRVKGIIQRAHALFS